MVVCIELDVIMDCSAIVGKMGSKVKPIIRPNMAIKVKGKIVPYLFNEH